MLLDGLEVLRVSLDLETDASKGSLKRDVPLVILAGR
jgi:hypothetical protein